MTHEFLPTNSAGDAARFRATGLWKDKSLYAAFRETAVEVPEKVAIICGDRAIRYSELLTRIDNLAGNLVARGIAPGEIVAVQMPNSPEHLLIHLALNSIGALYMPMHDSFREKELRHLLGKAGAVAAIIPLHYRGFDYPALYAELRADLPALKDVFSIGGATAGTADFAMLLEPTATPRSEVAARLPNADALALIMLSSGTTAMPKISVYTSNNVRALMDAFARSMHLSRDDVACALAPMSTGSVGYVLAPLPTLLAGGTLVILETWDDPAVAVDLIANNRCTFAVAIPTQMAMMLPIFETRSPHLFEQFRCFGNGGAPLPHEVAHRIEELLGCRIVSVYGTSDGGVLVISSIDDPVECRRSKVGRPVEGAICEVRDPDGRPVAVGTPGEICWITPNKSFGYLNDSEATRAVFDERGFHKSGDIGTMDAEGYISIVGRVKDMILRGGRNISPRLIEEALIAHPAILGVTVAAMPNPTLGEQACAFVVLRQGQSLSFDDVVRFLSEQKVPKYQLPERLEIVDAFPMSSGGKVMKHKLTELVTAKLVAEGKIAARL
jgi:non-ribosomal peptide synthetase component E (peptide arylation enzyme)